MSEECAGGRGEGEEHFGRVVLHTDRRELYYLDLYETHDAPDPGLACRGYYVHPELVMRSTPVPMRVELSMDAAAFNVLYDTFGGGTLEEERPFDPDAPYFDTFVLGGDLRDEGPVFDAQVRAPLRLPDKTVWTGSLASKEGQVTGLFDFILEQYGTIEPALLLLVALFVVVFYDRNGRRQAEECYQQALRICGYAENIKSVNATSGITGMTLRVDKGCQIECFEHRHSARTGGVEPPEGDEG